MWFFLLALLIGSSAQASLPTVLGPTICSTFDLSTDLIIDIKPGPARFPIRISSPAHNYRFKDYHGTFLLARQRAPASHKVYRIQLFDIKTGWPAGIKIDLDQTLTSIAGIITYGQTDSHRIICGPNGPLDRIFIFSH